MVATRKKRRKTDRRKGKERRTGIGAHGGRRRQMERRR